VHNSELHEQTERTLTLPYMFVHLHVCNLENERRVWRIFHVE